MFSRPAPRQRRAGRSRAGRRSFAIRKWWREGVTRTRLPSRNEVICTLGDPAVATLAKEIGDTRSAAAVELWRERIAGAVVAIGNAPTALFRLLDMLEQMKERPACIIGMPVGFVGAAESKEALMDARAGALHHRARAQRRQRHDGRRPQRAGGRAE